MISQYLQAKRLRCRDYRVLLRIAQAIEKIFGYRSNRKTRFFDYAILRRFKGSKQKTFSQADRGFGIKQFYKHGRYT